MKKTLNMLTAIFAKICFYLCFASMFIIVLMMVLMFVDSMMGLFINQRIAGSYELVQVMLSILVFSSWAYTQTVYGHINVVMFIRMFPQKLRFICYGLTSILSTVTMCFAARAVFGMIADKMASGEATGTLLIPLWPFYIFEFLAFALLAIVLLFDAVKALIAIKDQGYAEEIMSTWT